MIIIDTNVISELVKPERMIDRALKRWSVSLPLGIMATTTVSYAENLAGFRMNAGNQSITVKQRTFEQIITVLFEERIYAFDRTAADEYAELSRHRKMLGRPMARLDMQIAAIARARKLPIATRDRDFEGCGVETINPWDHAP